MQATRDFLITAWALLATGACVVLAAWLREERRQNRYLAALKARDWPEVERLMEFGDQQDTGEGDPAVLARQRRAAYRSEAAPCPALPGDDYWTQFERARDAAANQDAAS